MKQLDFWENLPTFANLDDSIDLLGDRKSEVDAILKELQTTKEYGTYDMLLCKLESILKERNLID